ncbi:hypothetical protein [Kaarinaea lacus]
MQSNSVAKWDYRKPALLIGMVLLFFAAMGIVYADGNTEPDSPGETEAQIIQKFTSQENIESEVVTIDDQRKRQVMFAMGVPLLLFIIITVILGIAMGVYGKNVYIPHMIFAGLSLTLALAHAIVGLVWFWPF